MRPLTGAEYALGAVMLLIFHAAIILMLATHYNLVAQAGIEEERQKRIADREKHKRLGAIVARRLYRKYIESTKVQVRQEIELVNESDIDWGGEE